MKVCIDKRAGHLSGQRVQVTGRLRRNVWPPRGYLELVLYVTRITASEPPQEDWSAPLRDIGTRRQGEWPTVERAFENHLRAGMPPRVVLLVGTSAQVDQDVRAALGEHTGAYQLIVERVSMIDPVTIAEAVAVPAAGRGSRSPWSAVGGTGCRCAPTGRSVRLSRTRWVYHSCRPWGTRRGSVAKLLFREF